MTAQAALVTWKSVADALDLAAWLVHGPSLRIVHANAGAGRLVGRDPQAMVGSLVLELACTPEDQIFWGQSVQDLALGIASRSSVQQAGRDELIAVDRHVTALRGEGTQDLLLMTMRDCSREEAAERALLGQIAQLGSTLDAAADGMLSCDLQGGIRAFNHAWARIWQLPRSLLIQRNDAAIAAHMQSLVQDPAAYGERLGALAQDPMHEARDVLHLADGTVLERRAVPQWTNGHPSGRVFTFRDITLQVRQQAELRLAAQAFESSLDAIFVADQAGVVVRVNPSCEQLWLTDSAAVVGVPVLQFLSALPERGRLMEQVRQAWSQGNVWEGELFLPRPGAGTTVVRLSWVALRDAAGALTQSIGFMQDLTPQHAAERRVEELAYRDVLTGLPNRLSFGQRVSQAIDEAQGSGTGFAIMLLDLDRFRNINDSLGHPFGDRALRVVAHRLQDCLHHSDMLCRIGGDEFVVYLHAANAGGAEAVARRVMEAVARPCVVDDMTLSLQCSIGLTLFPQDARTVDELISQADAAMNRVKERGRGSFGFYQPRMSADLLPRMKLEHALRQALQQGHMAVHYQPQVDLESGAIVGAEALVRWTDPELGAVPPSQFIPLAEETGYIATLGAWVMDRAIDDAAQWAAAGEQLSVAVNVSAIEFRQAGFIERVTSLLARHGLAPHLLELELTESVLLNDVEEMEARIAALAAMGVSLAIDDFGTGYSSLAYLKRLKIHKLKIDQSFVRGLPQDEGDRAIVQAITSMGSALQMKVLAEGVETEAQRQALRQMPCAYYQGFLCSPALPADEFRTLATLRHTLRG
ncbi:MAG: diguanylate cyclase [Burkholderiales bacterium 66-5]|nr:MAG: diguanylate cyclase [Burkholderiales bacterium 66-5]